MREIIFGVGGFFENNAQNYSTVVPEPGGPALLKKYQPIRES